MMPAGLPEEGGPAHMTHAAKIRKRLQNTKFRKAFAATSFSRFRVVWAHSTVVCCLALFLRNPVSKAVRRGHRCDSTR